MAVVVMDFNSEKEVDLESTEWTFGNLDVEDREESYADLTIGDPSSGKVGVMQVRIFKADLLKLLQGWL